MNIKQLIGTIVVLAISALAVLATTGPAFAVETAPTATQAQPAAIKIRTVIRAEAVPARTEGPLASLYTETIEPAAAVVKSRIALLSNARSLDTVHALRT